MRAGFRLPISMLGLVPAAALAQDFTSSSSDLTEAAVAEALDAPYLVRVAAPGAWRAGDLIGKPLYDLQGNKIGKVSDVLITADRSVTALIVSLQDDQGVGMKTVALRMSALTLAPGDPQKRADEVSEAHPDVAPAPSAVVSEAFAGAGASEETDSDGNDGAIKLEPDGLPERLVADVTREQIMAAPALSWR
ncbi:MAG: PRC-barrel domain-containing protein [Pseudomonadota bacterium]|nr:PRC-barrel domain-containing protein [Pseudomonadota bacterium]